MKVVEKAKQEQLGIWYRFLPSPTNEEQQQILLRLIQRFEKLGGWNPKLGKKIGWAS
jgi:hypothetical protein